MMTVYPPFDFFGPVGLPVPRLPFRHLHMQLRTKVLHLDPQAIHLPLLSLQRLNDLTIFVGGSAFAYMQPVLPCTLRASDGTLGHWDTHIKNLHNGPTYIVGILYVGPMWRFFMWWAIV